MVKRSLCTDHMFSLFVTPVKQELRLEGRSVCMCLINQMIGDLILRSVTPGEDSVCSAMVKAEKGAFVPWYKLRNRVRK